jgi:hypothetical protein
MLASACTQVDRGRGALTALAPEPGQDGGKGRIAVLAHQRPDGDPSEGASERLDHRRISPRPYRGVGSLAVQRHDRLPAGLPRTIGGTRTVMLDVTFMLPLPMQPRSPHRFPSDIRQAGDAQASVGPIGADLYPLDEQLDDPRLLRGKHLFP